MIENVIMLNRKIYPCSGNCSRGKFLKKDSSLLFITKYKNSKSQ